MRLKIYILFNRYRHDLYLFHLSNNVIRFTRYYSWTHRRLTYLSFSTKYGSYLYITQKVHDLRSTIQFTTLITPYLDLDIDTFLSWVSVYIFKKFSKFIFLDEGLTYILPFFFPLLGSLGFYSLTTIELFFDNMLNLSSIII